MMGLHDLLERARLSLDVREVVLQPLTLEVPAVPAAPTIRSAAAHQRSVQLLPHQVVWCLEAAVPAGAMVVPG